MIFFIFLMFGFFILLSVWLGFKFGLSTGQRSLMSGSGNWWPFITGAANIFAIQAIAAAGWQVLFALDGGFLVSLGVFLLSCAAVAVYAAVIWLPVYALCYWDTRRTGLKASQG